MKPTVRSLFAVLGIVCTLAFHANTFAREGGVGDGGGNAFEEGRLEPSAIEDMLQKAKTPTFYVLKRLEYVLAIYQRGPMPDPKLASIYNKLFRGPKTIYQALDQAVFAPIPTGGCQGVGSELEKDANALRAPPNICFSLESLGTKLMEHSGPGQLIALIVHELSHVCGATEDEAITVQAMTSQTSSSILQPFQTSTPLTEILRSTKDHLNDMIAQTVDALGRQSGSDAIAALCMATMGNVTESSELMSANFRYLDAPGISLYSFAEQMKLAAVLLKSSNLMFACRTYDPDKKEALAKAFSGRKQLPVEEFAKIYFNSNDEDLVGTYPNLVIRDVRTRDKNAIRGELNDIVNLEKQVLSTLK